MTPQEKKAKELVDRFKRKIISSPFVVRPTLDYKEEVMMLSKMQAVIAVDEIIKDFNHNWTWLGKELENKQRWSERFNFWQEVKTQIQKL